MGTPQQPLTVKLDVGEDGFLLHPETWNRDVAQLLAQGEVEGSLTNDHWRIIDYLRQYYLEFDTVPPVRMLRKYTRCGIECVYKLFPSGIARGACRVAGIPGAKCWMLGGSF